MMNFKRKMVVNHLLLKWLLNIHSYVKSVSEKILLEKLVSMIGGCVLMRSSSQRSLNALMILGSSVVTLKFW